MQRTRRPDSQTKPKNYVVPAFVAVKVVIKINHRAAFTEPGCIYLMHYKIVATTVAARLQCCICPMHCSPVAQFY